MVSSSSTRHSETPARFTWRVERSILDEFSDVAEGERRSVNAELTVAVINHLRAHRTSSRARDREERA